VNQIERELGMQDARTKSPVDTGLIELPELDDRRSFSERRMAASDRRDTPRRKMLKVGRTYWANGDSIECSVRNLSESGAQLQVRGTIPNIFDLVIGDDQFRRSCCVVWRNAERVGVRFIESFKPVRSSVGPVSRITEFRQYAEFCRTLARGADVLSREMLLKMATAWEAHARRPRRRANIW
jgi:PilZ domain-containing protein